ncbi:MAG: hypothetical protein L0Y61_02140 [Epsilonproteobacteria bacterium]|nr:hypothetical protein [Campylobacterota bacterium]
MYKKIILTLGLTLSLFGNEPHTKYLDDSKMDYSDLQVFIGVDGSYNYQSASEKLDNSAIGYSIYTGIPIYGLELIAKKTVKDSNSLELAMQNITLNIPVSGTGSRSLYVGFLAGNAKVTYSDNIVNSNGLIEKSTDGNFYGVHIGKRYKFSQNFFGRMEFEYLKYNLQTKNNTGTSLEFSNDSSFIYGLEYRF